MRLMQNGNLESTQKRMTNLSADLSFMPDNELVELVWQDGQILMQGHSNKTRKIPPTSVFSPHTCKPQEKDGGCIVNPKNGISRTSDSGLSDYPHLVPSAHSGLGQNDDTVPWLNCPLYDTMQHDNFSEFFSELPGVNLNENDAVPVYRDINSGHIVRNSRAVLGHSAVNPEPGNLSKVAGGVPQPTRPRNSQIHPSSLRQGQNSGPSLRSRISDFYRSNTNNTYQPGCSISSQILNPTIGSPNMQMQKQDQQLKRPPPQLNSRTGLMNFSHFARPAALIKSNLHSIGATTTPDLSSIDKLTSNDKVLTANSSNSVESILIGSTSGYKSVTGFQSQLVSVSSMADARSSVTKPPKEPLLTEQSEAICQEDFSTSNRLPDQVLVYSSSFAASTSIGSQDVASSSLCSASSAGGTSSNPKHNLKRTSRDTEDSECQSEDVEEESVGGRKPASARGVTGSKRSRAAEVHNLSERRRRDRINEKMRALQELIPNCNKVDKASMLDEAIEYLKTLQLQVQIMSMATGLYMPPMVSPTGVQHIHAPHLSHFFPMGVGMGTGFGLGVNLGMGMLDISGGSSACTSIQVPPIHGAQFSGPSISGTTSFPPMAGSSMQMFGLPGQGLSMSMPWAPFIPLSEGPSMKPLTVADVSGTATHVEQPGSASVPSSSTKFATQCAISTMMHQTNAHCLQDHTSSQSEATKGGYEQIALAWRADRIAHVNDSGGVNSTTKGNESSKANIES